jgi:glycosyltransferase involved in cell wall biosynthesis
MQTACEWARAGKVVWLAYGDESIFARLSALDVQPLVWNHLPVSRSERSWLEDERISGLVTVSDTCRVPLLRSPRHDRVGRVYNPLAPLFAEQIAGVSDRFERHVVVYAGAAGPTKGLHRLLQMWQHVHRTDSRAKLILAGTGRLYGNNRSLGRRGVADPDFENRYVEPLVAEFGSLESAGIEVAGLLNPADLRNLYSSSSLGVVNPNWSEYTETFCCAAVEMIGTGLPVFSVARASLPETIGRSGGALLTQTESVRRAAGELTALLSDSQRLARLGAAGRQFVVAEYGWDTIVDDWEVLLAHGPEIEPLSGAWRGPRSAKYYVELFAGRAGGSWLLDSIADGLRMLRRRRE